MAVNLFFRQSIILVFFLFISVIAKGRNEVNPVLIKYDKTLEPFDYLEDLRIFPDSTSKSKSKPSDDFPTFPDLVYEYKVASIGKLSPIDFDYNPHVRRYIDIYSIERREQVSQILGLAELYFPLFDEMLDKYHLPLELKYLAVVESALNPLAVSKTGATGLWQFKINSAKMFNLTVNSYVDERMDPAKSTEAACQYLQYLYKIFNNWHLALAAYNTGPGAIRNAISRANGETNFWKIYDYLPESAQNYVPAFIAAAYIMNNANNHHINAIKPIINYAKIDTVMISKPVKFVTISKELGIPIELIRFLNPVYRRDFLPDLGRPITLWLPTNKVEQFLQKEKIIYNSKVETATYNDILANSGNTDGKIRVQHKVKSGEYLHKIAINYGCTIDDILIWNPNVDDNLSKGEYLNIWVDKKIYQRIQDTSSDSLKTSTNQ
ncbi:MAG: transglycosylase SLT domain-containing protein [Bacteroidales bacterium]|nr:transglycosylase SLT domain-containing protein [Bacteroidales bacterium]